jgi:hypothetical protein
MNVSAFLDEILGYLRTLDDKNPRFTPLPKVFTAYIYSYAYHCSSSKFYLRDTLLKKSWDLIVQGKEWNQVVEGNPYRSTDFYTLAMFNYMKITPELSEKRSKYIKNHLLEIANKIVSNEKKSIKLVDIPNHGILKTLFCEYAYDLTKKPIYKVKSLKLKDYVLSNFDEGIAPEISANYLALNVFFLSELYRQTKDRYLLENIRRTADTIPELIYKKTADIIAIENREVLKAVSSIPHGSIYAAMISASNILNDRKYLSVGRNALHYLKKYSNKGACVPFPRWRLDKEIADPAKLIDWIDSREAMSAWIGFIISFATQIYGLKNIQPKNYPLKKQIRTSSLLLKKKSIGDSEAIISNVYQSPISYMTKNPCLVGWVASDGCEYQALNLKAQLNTVTDDAASMYFSPIQSHSTAFFHKNIIIWIHTIKNNNLKDISWTGLLYSNKNKIFCGKEEEIIEADLGEKNFPLKWVLLPSGKGFLGVALLGTAKMAVKNNLKIIYKMEGVPSKNVYSILLIREWDKTPEDWNNWLNKWSVVEKRGSYQIRTPDSCLYDVNHGKKYFIERFNKKFKLAIKKYRLEH